MQSLSISSFTLFPLASVPSTAWMKFMDEVHWFARGKLQLTSHSVGNFSRWVVVLGQRKMCRRDSESREKRDCSFITSSTSSTAQGGGGSFKNRKPIGDVGCCESGMAERSHWLTERWLELCLLEWLQWLQWSPHPQLLDVVWCTATVVVVVA